NSAGGYGLAGVRQGMTPCSPENQRQHCAAQSCREPVCLCHLPDHFGILSLLIVRRTLTYRRGSMVLNGVTRRPQDPFQNCWTVLLQRHGALRNWRKLSTAW